MHEILKNVQVHIPFHILQKRLLPRVIKEGINPEISFNYVTLDHYRNEEYVEIADKLLDAGLRVTFHAPFMDLRPGAVDPEIRRITIDRLQQVFALVPYFRPLSVVCHPSFDRRYYVSSEHTWLENSIKTWSHFLTQAREMNTVIALENVYETDPHHLGLLLDAYTSPHICFCFDTGHYNVFSTAPLQEWIERLGSSIGQIHIHDNNGTLDEHLPAGEGNFPFRNLFNMIRERKLKPIVTLETHREEHLWRMLENIKSMNLLG